MKEGTNKNNFHLIYNDLTLLYSQEKYDQKENEIKIENICQLKMEKNNYIKEQLLVEKLKLKEATKKN